MAITTTTVMNTPPTRNRRADPSCTRLVDGTGGSGTAAVLVIDLSAGRRSGHSMPPRAARMRPSAVSGLVDGDRVGAVLARAASRCRCAEDGVQRCAGLGRVGLGHREQLLAVGPDDAVLEEVGAGERTEAGLLGPLLVERRDLGALVDGIELAVRDVPADGVDLAVQAGVLDGLVGVLGGDVDVLDELEVGVVGDERRVRGIGVAGLERRRSARWSRR